MPNPSLPAELLDQIVDHLHHSRDALRSCCLVSKSWIPRARRHLFDRVEFRHVSDVQSWERIFPVPSTSPVRYTKTLLIKCPGKLRAAGVGKDCWIQTFSRITQLEIDVPGRALMVILEASLTPFYGLSPFIKSLCIASNYLLPETFGLIYSFPLLEDLSVVVNDLGDILLESRRLVATQPSSPPPLTGTLKLCVLSGTDAIPSTLLSLPSGLHFRKLYLKGGYHNASTCTWGTALVEKCRDTLESIEIRGPILNLLDLSKATKLKKVEFEIDQRSPQDVVAVLRTLTNNHQNLQWISISTTYAITGREFAGTGMSNVNRLWLPNAVEAWLELDRLVAQLWESRRTRMRVQYCSTVWEDRGKARSCMEDLLPQLTMRGAVDIIEKMIY